MIEGDLFSLPVKICLLNTPNCNLPQKYASTFVSVKFLQLTWSNQTTHVYISWAGGISTSDCLELPTSFQYQSIDAAIVNVSQVSEVHKASDVNLKPCTSFDWDIVATHAVFIEDNLLRNKSMLFTGEILRITISSSLIACLIVTRIQCREDSSDISLGILTNRTSLVIEPFTSTPPESNPNARLDQTQDLCVNFKSYPLRVLPKSLVANNTSFFNDSSFKAKITTNSFTSTDLDAMLDAMGMVDEVAVEAGVDDCDRHQNEINVLGSSAVIVHPLYFQFLYEQSSHTHLINDKWHKKGENSEINCAMAREQYRAMISSSEDSRSGHRTFLAMATIATQLKDITVSTENITQSPSVLVRVVTSERVRPLHVELSPSTRLALQCADNDKLQLQLINDSDLRFVLPASITLSPVRWVSAASQDSVESNPTTGDVISPSDNISAGGLQSAFLRWVETQQLSGGTLIHNEQLISLDFWCSADTCASSSSNNENGGRNRYTKDFVVAFSTSKTANRPLDNDEGKQSAAHFVLDPSDPSHDVMLSACLEALILSATATSRVRIIHLENTVVATPSSSTALLRVFKPTVREVVSEIMTNLLPLAALDRLQRDVRPPVGVLLTAASGGGKSALSREILDILQTSPRLLASTHSLDCNSLLSMSVETALVRLSEAFEVAMANAPSVICLENLHTICPSVSESGSGSLRDERCSLLSLHLERLLQDNYQRQLQNHEDCMQLAHKYDISGRGEDWSGVSGEYFVRDRLTARALSCAVFVLGTAPSVTAVHPRLLNFDCLRKVVCLNSIGARDRLQLLSSALQSQGISLAESLSTDDVERVLEGFVLGDFYSLASRVSAAIYCKVVARLQPSSLDPSVLKKMLLATLDDISTAAASFVASAAGKLSSSGAPAFDVSWADIGGFKSVKRSILEVVRIPLLYHKLYRLSPVKMPRAILLYGPPGCGKTYVAQAAGREFGVDFISIRGPQLLDKYIGASEKAVRELFNRARETGRPTLLFFDEFEALAPKRGKDNTGITDRIVNQLLTFIDGVESSMGGGEGAAQVFLIAATSRPDLVDGALLRPGRIEKHIYIGLPSVEDRESILNMCLSKLSVNDTISESVQWIAQQDKAAAMTAADLKAVVSTAFLLAAHEIIDNANTAHKSTVVIDAAHLRQAFGQTRASVSEHDMAFYTDTYEKFKPSKEGKENAKKGGGSAAALSTENQKMSFR